MNRQIPYHWGKDIHDAWADRGRTFTMPVYSTAGQIAADRGRRILNNQTVY